MRNASFPKFYVETLGKQMRQAFKYTKI